MKMMAPDDKEQAGGDRRNPWGPQHSRTCLGQGGTRAEHHGKKMSKIKINSSDTILSDKSRRSEGLVSHRVPGEAKGSGYQHIPHHPVGTLGTSLCPARVQTDRVGCTKARAQVFC